MVSASIMPWRPTPDTMRLEFYAAPAALPNVSVTVVVWADPLTGEGYRFRMKDFLPAAP